MALSKEEREYIAKMEGLLWDALTDIDDDYDGFYDWRSEVVRFFGKDPGTSSAWGTPPELRTNERERIKSETTA